MKTDVGVGKQAEKVAKKLATRYADSSIRDRFVSSAEMLKFAAEGYDLNYIKQRCHDH